MPLFITYIFLRIYANKKTISHKQKILFSFFKKKYCFFTEYCVLIFLCKKYIPYIYVSLLLQTIKQKNMPLCSLSSKFSVFFLYVRFIKLPKYFKMKKTPTNHTILNSNYLSEEKSNT